MRLLLDTHVWLWSISSPERIHEDIRRLVEDPANLVFLSAASSWEIAIKHELGKLALPEHPRDLIPSRLVRDRIQPLPVEHRHAVEVAGLPPHHRDPFDRMLVVQARIENLSFVTVDPRIAPYDVDVLWADRPWSGKIVREALEEKRRTLRAGEDPWFSLHEPYRGPCPRDLAERHDDHLAEVQGEEHDG